MLTVQHVFITFQLELEKQKVFRLELSLKEHQKSIHQFQRGECIYMYMYMYIQVTAVKMHSMVMCPDVGVFFFAFG